jgi:hypothetical protein
MKARAKKWTHVRVEETENACLAELARRMGVSKAAWVRIAIRQAWRREEGSDVPLTSRISRKAPA